MREHSQETLKVGIVGCGQVAKHHLRFISALKDAQVVGVADVNTHNARSLGQMYGVQDVYGSLEELLQTAEIDAVHILTPPAYHYEQAWEAIEHGVHVLVEKPIAFSASQTEELYNKAKENNRIICPDFIQLFNPLFQSALAAVNSGSLGRVFHVNCHWSVELDKQSTESPDLHWSYRLPGGVLHNYITHLLYLSLHWTGSLERLTAVPRSYGSLPQGITDHIDILIEGNRCTASIVLSLAVQPRGYYLKLLCERGTVLINFDSCTVLVERKHALPSSLIRATANFARAYQHGHWGVKNIIKYLTGALVPYQGLQNLIPSFYEQIRRSGESPVTRELAVAVTKAEEEVFAEARKLHFNTSRRPSAQQGVRRPERVLVTGASGYVGSRVVNQLVAAGYAVRGLVRPLSRIEPLERFGVELVFGDVRDFESVCQASEGIDVIVHLAAGLRGSKAFIVDSCVSGTRNVARAAKAAGVKRVIYMSSLSVYDYALIRDGETVTGQSPLERRPEVRGVYSLGKRQAEEIALACLNNGSSRWTILRPPVIVGKGVNPVSAAGVLVGKLLICFSPPNKQMRLVHVEDVAAAIVRLLQVRETEGQIFTLSAPDSLTLRDYVDRALRKDHPGLKAVYVPYWAASLMSAGTKVLCFTTRRAPIMSSNRLAYLYRSVRVDSTEISTLTGWQPSSIASLL